MLGQKVTAVVGGFSLLVLGAVIGVTVDRVLASRSLTVDPGQDLHKEAVQFFESEFDLDDEQVVRLHKVFIDHQSSVDSSWQRLRPHLLSAMDSVHTEIETMLDPRQRAHFKQWLAKQGAEMMHRTHDLKERPEHD